MLSKLIRLPLKAIPNNAVIPVLSGAACGIRWIAGSATHGCWLGTYERNRQRRLKQVLHCGDCFLDIGANVGFYSLLAGRLVGELGHVHSFEPLPRNLAYLNRHVDLNRLRNLTVHPLALSEGPERTMSFAKSINPSSGHLLAERSAETSIEVSVKSLDMLWKENVFLTPSVIKIDVEGAEASVLRGGEEMLRTCRPVILLAGHGTDMQERCCNLLVQWGYQIHLDRNGFDDGMYESTAFPVNT